MTTKRHSDFALVEFLDEADSNHEDKGLLVSIDLVDTEGNEKGISDYEGPKNLLIVFTSDFSGRICPCCTK
ncbi:MAG: hypothetical protein CMM05_08525 [Rhodopirellula sp.]|nr:hypothetical protein [Rhodopirellula sp.]|tara:strand:- start:641 stop:853 length:213 start_codon:yes stop_codon:yes gene_type:complete